MPLRILDYLTESALSAEVNEDAIGFTPFATWVIDGGTTLARPVIDRVSDARWHSSELSLGLKRQFLTSSVDPVVALRRAINVLSVKSQGKFDGIVPPSSSVGIVTVAHIAPYYCSYAILGDISVLYKSAGSARMEALRFPRRTETEVKLISNYVDLRCKGCSRDEAQALILRDIEERRKTWMNRKGGYWIASIHPDAADFAQHGSLQVASGDRLLLMSDGFAVAQETYGAVSEWTGVIDAEIGLSEVLGRIRLAEDGDADCIDYPRLKRSDDASALLLEVF